MNDELKNDIVETFRNITHLSAEEARHLLDTCSWKLDVALERFLEENEVEDIGFDVSDEMDEETEENPIEEPKTTSSLSSSSSSKSADKPKPKPKPKPISSTSHIHTIHSLRNASNENNSDSDDDQGQAFYAGGSERSGQQILGPNKNKDMIMDMFKSLKERGAEVVDMKDLAKKKRSKSNHKAFSGIGFKLGETNEASEQVAGPSSESPNSIESTSIKLYKNGFTVNDGELRLYDDPENKLFLTSIRKGEVPAELLRMAKNREVHVNMEDHHYEEYVPKQGSNVNAFSGRGHVLGNIVPNFVSNDNPVATPAVPLSKPASDLTIKKVDLDSEMPTTTIQIRLRDGSKLSSQFNLSHTISDIRRFIIMNRPEYEHVDFTLMIPFPRTKLVDENQTIAEANLMNSTLTQDIQ